MTHFQGKSLLAIVAVTTLTLVGMAFLSAGSYIAALPYVMVPTAHVAFAFFWMAFTASSVHRLHPGPYSRWAMKNRRYIGLSFAFIHIVHLMLVLSNITLTPDERPPLILAAGAVAYGFLFLMVLTSNNAAVKWLGTAKWRQLHLVGSWYIWVIFIAAIPEVLTGKYNRVWIFILCFAALALRFAAYKKRKAGTPRPA